MISLMYRFESRYHEDRDCIFNMIYKGNLFNDTGKIAKSRRLASFPKKITRLSCASRSTNLSP